MIFKDDVFDWKTYVKSCCILVLVMALQMVSKGVAYWLFVPVILFAIAQKKSEQQVFWILLTITMMLGNVYFMPKGPVFYIGNRFVMGVFGLMGLIQLSGQRKSPILVPFLWLLVYLFYAIIPSASGWSPIISYLKITLFIVVFVAYFGVANTVIQDHRTDVRKLRGMLLAMSSFFIVGSVLVLPFPNIGQLSGEEYVLAMQAGKDVTSLFKGMTIHSQTLGPLVCALFTILLADLVFNVRKWDKLYVLLLLLCPFLIYKTSSRVGMVSFIMGLLCVCGCLMIEHRIGSRWRSRVLSKFWLILVVCAAVAVMVPSVRDGVVKFALKYNYEAKAGDFNMEEAMSTRQLIIDEQMENFRRKPMIGNGFQVSSAMEGFEARSIVSLLSAPVEKGVWVTAVLEEGGVVGLILVCVFILHCGLSLLRRKAYTAFSVFFVLVISNMAEMTMFSMSSTGGFLWGMVFVGAALDGVAQRNRLRRGQLPWWAGGAFA